MLPKSRAKRIAIFLSLLFHVVLIAVLAFYIYNPLNRANQGDKSVASSGSSSSGSGPGKGTRGGQSPSELKSSVGEDLDVNAMLSEKMKESEQRSDEDNREQADQLGQRLEDISSEENVDEMADRLHSWLGTSTRATEPAAGPVEGDFDYETAQIHDVTREATGEDEWSYTTVLLDADGRTMSVPVEDPATGAQLWKTMQTIKKYPLLEKVYRKSVMPYLDKLLGEQKSANK